MSAWGCMSAWSSMGACSSIGAWSSMGAWGDVSARVGMCAWGDTDTRADVSAWVMCVHGPAWVHVWGSGRGWMGKGHGALVTGVTACADSRRAPRTRNEIVVDMQRPVDSTTLSSTLSSIPSTPQACTSRPAGAHRADPSHPCSSMRTIRPQQQVRNEGRGRAQRGVVLVSRKGE
eukprot:357108-Chlamydomonas_euryale.AAC.3